MVVYLFFRRRATVIHSCLNRVGLSLNQLFGINAMTALTSILKSYLGVLPSGFVYISH
jgi:hypothetical protein